MLTGYSIFLMIIMKMKLFFSVLLLTASIVTTAQTAKIAKKTTGKANDHFLLQFSSDTWNGLPDSVATKGFSRGAGIYGMMNFPFKTSKNFSVALGAGIGSSHLYLDKAEVDIEGSTQTVTFKNLTNKNHFKKYKVAIAYLEAPVELRWAANPDNIDKSFKFAIGVKVGTLLSSYTKGKNLADGATGNTINAYTEKIKKKTYFNNNRIAATARIGWGHFSVFGQYQLTTVFRENLAAPIRPLSIGLTISGL